MPAKVPFYLPILGSVFAILVVKCLFGGLGHNIMNPALTGRAFLLISFGSMMTQYSVDGVSAATPLALLGQGQTVELLPILMGSASGVIGSSALGLILGGIYLLLRGGITWEIPASMIATTWLFLVIFGGHGFAPSYILPQLFGGGLLMAAFFMATDPVSCPSTRDGQLVFGIFAGLLIGLFRVKGASPDSTTYAVLIADLVGPVIDDLIIPTPFGYRIPKERQTAIPKPVIILLVITLVAGLALSGVYVLTKDTIAENQALANKAALMEVLPEAADFVSDDDLQAKISAQGDTYGADFGGAKIQGAAVGVDASGNVVGYAVTVFNSYSYDGGLTLVVDQIFARINSSNPLLISIFSQKEKALAILKSHPCVQTIAVQGDEIKLGFLGDRQDEALLLQQLIDADVMVSSFMREKGSLESLFMQITGHEEERAVLKH